MTNKIPKPVIEILEKLETAGFEAFIVGGCVRDLLIGKVPKDWDITTNAKPSEIQKVFPDSFYENKFGTVGVKTPTRGLTRTNTRKNAERDQRESAPSPRESAASVVEVTTYRIESKYSDKRHPDSVKFAKTIEEDLSRRDFTINAMALKLKTKNEKLKATTKKSKLGKSQNTDYEIIDIFKGQNDLKDKAIRAVGEPNDRFLEDALRMMRAVRFAVELGFEIEKKTAAAIVKNSKNLSYISKERIRDEFGKIILSSEPAKGVELLHELGLLKLIIPEIEIGFNVTQGHHHYYGPYNTVYKHSIASLEKCPSLKLEVRLAALLHDVGKPQVKRGRGENATFYAHEYAGAKIVRRILERLKFPNAIIDKVELLVKNHMFYYNVDEVGEAGVRRVIRKVGLENIKDLIDVRIADRLGSGVPKAVPYKLRHFKYMVEKLSKDPLSAKQLKINGNDLIKTLKIKPGPKIGAILDILLADVIEDPKLNTKEKLLARAKELDKKNLEDLRRTAKDRIKKEKQKEDKLIKDKYWVK